MSAIFYRANNKYWNLIMLNEALYDCLVELGANVTRAREAAEENAKLDIIRLEVSETHQGVFQLTRQTAEMNDRLIGVEKDTKELKERMTNMEERMTNMEDKMGNMEKMLRILVDRA